MVHQEKPQQMLRLFCCTIPFGTDSHFAQALMFVSRGLVAKNAPQEHFLNVPTDGAPRKAATNVAAFSGAPSGTLPRAKERRTVAFLTALRAAALFEYP